jgi:hypothetical protein
VAHLGVLAVLAVVTSGVVYDVQQVVLRTLARRGSFVGPGGSHRRPGRSSREIAEQMMIDRLGGIDNLRNVVNPIGPKRFPLMPIQPYSR